MPFVWPSQSRRRTSPETDGAEKDAPETDVPETDGPETDVPETDAPETDGVETDAPDTDVPETEKDRDGGRPRRRKTEADVPETDGVLLLWKLGLSGCYSLISFEWCVSVQRCMSLVDDSTGVCGGGVGARVVGGGVYGCVWRRGWQKEDVFSWDRVFMIELHAVAS